MGRLGYARNRATEKYAFRLNCSQLHVNIAEDCQVLYFEINAAIDLKITIFLSPKMPNRKRNDCRVQKFFISLSINGKFTDDYQNVCLRSL